MSNSISRQEKLEKLKEPYPRDFPVRETIKSLTHDFSVARDLKMLNGNITKEVRKIAGRIESRRDHGNNIFFTIFDQTGEIQILAKMHNDLSTRIPPYAYNDYWDIAKNSDISDMAGIEGTLSANKRGEPLLLISNFTILAKALKDPPANFHGVKNPELKYRHREVDLLSSAETRELFKTRAKIVFEIRKYLNALDYIEIECPVLQPIYGGATARPFKTKHNALGQEFFLSISSELYLKRAMVGGFDRVYSFSRCFRNEGISPTHNPEFTNLEIFQTCSDHNDMRVFTMNLLNEFIKNKNFDIELKSNFSTLDWPLSRKWPKDESLAEAWELYIDGMEIASGASDLNDPREQADRLLHGRISADDIVPDEDYLPDDPYDQNYIEALEMGALPWAGVGIGIDRLVMLLTGKINIREIILFPTLRNEK